MSRTTPHATHTSLSTRITDAHGDPLRIMDGGDGEVHLTITQDATQTAAWCGPASMVREAMDKWVPAPAAPGRGAANIAALVDYAAAIRLAEALKRAGHAEVAREMPVGDLRNLIREALTPRPDGARALEAVIGRHAGKWTDGADDARALADTLASHGVRATTDN